MRKSNRSYRIATLTDPKRIAALKPEERSGYTMPMHLLKHERRGTNWVVDGILASSSIAMMGGEEGHGKTFLTFQLMRSLTTGEPFLGKFKVFEPGNVVFVALDDPRADAIYSYYREFFDERESKARFASKEPTPYVYRDSEFPSLDDERIVERLSAIAETHSPKVIVIDNLTFLLEAATAGNSRSVDAARMKRLRKFTERTGVTVLILAHLRKEPSQGRSRRHTSRPVTVQDFAGNCFSSADDRWLLWWDKVGAGSPREKSVIQFQTRSAAQERPIEELVTRSKNRWKIRESEPKASSVADVRKSIRQLPKQQKAVAEALSAKPQTLRDLGAKVALKEGHLSKILSNLKQMGFASSAGRGLWQRG